MAGETTTIIIFGGTGDLARRKLLPALFQLWCKGPLPESFRIFGFARRENSDDKFRELWGMPSWSSATLLCAPSSGPSSPRMSSTCEVTLTTPNPMVGGGGWRSWRVAPVVSTGSFISPLPGTAIDNLGASGLAREETGCAGWSSKKPFGHDLESAQSLN